MKNKVLFVLLILVLAIAVFPAKYEKKFHKVIPIDSIRNFKLQNVNGSIIVETSKNDKIVVDAVIKGKKQAERDFNIKANVIVSGLRQFDLQRNMELAQLAVDYKNKGVVAFDLAGEEINHPAKKHIKAFEIAIQNNLCRTVHAGEADGAHSISEAIHHLGAQRIGHGTNLFQDQDLLKYIADRQIGLEVCLTSNMQTKSVRDIRKHPIKEYLKQHIAVTINTDSTLISGTNINKEFELATNLFNFTAEDIVKIMTNGFEQAFISIQEKEDLIKEVKSKYSKLLKGSSIE